MSDTAAPVAADPVKQFSVFIENRVGRLHDRILYTRRGSGWTRARLSP